MPITKLNSSRDFFRIWFLWKFQAISAFVLIVGLIMFYAYGSTPVYVSKAKVLLLPKTNRALVITAGADERQVIRPVTDQDLYTEVELMMSDRVLQETVRSIGDKGLGLRSEERGLYDTLVGAISGFFNKLLQALQLTEEPLSPIERDVNLLRRSLDIELAFGSSVLLVTLRGESPEDTSHVLDRILEVYVKRHSDVFTIDAGLDFYDDQAGMYLKRLEDAEVQLQAYNREYNVVDLENQNRANIGMMTELNTELQLIEITYDEAASRIRILKKTLEDSESEVLVTAEMRVIPAIVELEKAIIPLIIRQTEIAKGYTTTSREYQDVVQQVALLKGELRKEVAKALKTDELELETLSTKKNSLRRNVGMLEERATAFNQLKLKIQELERQVQIHKNHYLVYTSKTEDSRIYNEKKDRNLANVTVVDRPSTPERPSAPKRLLLLAVSLALGFFSALCLPFILEAWDHKLKTVDDVESLLGMQVVSSFPEVRK
jgi:succinoglycan biosynthesis transport protein ExoP